MAEFDPMGFFFGGENPEEQKARQERASMEAEEFRRSVYRMIEEMPTDHLNILRILCHKGMTPELGEYLCGLIVAQMHWVRNVCVSCGGPPHEQTAEACTHSTSSGF